LGTTGFNTVQARDGEEGCRIALEQLPDLILMDQEMPVMNGLEACRKFRSFPPLKLIPIILMTSAASLDGILNPFQVGADDYILKPFDANELIIRVQGSLAKKRAVNSLDRQAKDSKALLEIIFSVTSSLDTVEILREIAVRLAKLMDDVECCSMALIQEDKRGGYITASSDEPNLAGLRVFLDSCPEIREVMKTGKPILIDSGVKKSGPGGQKFNVTLALPFVYMKRIVGATVLKATRLRGGFSQKEIEFCQQAVNVAANALRNAHLFEVLREDSETHRKAQRHLEEELRFKAVYEQLFENASEGLVAFNPKGEVVFANRKALEIVGYSRMELQGVNFAVLLDIRSIPNVLRRQVQEETKEEQSRRFDVTIRNRKGSKRLLSISLNDSLVCGNLQVVAFRDVTEKRRMERELEKTKAVLEKTNERLKKMDRTRTEFLNTAAHELRIPVAIVNSYCSLLRDVGTDNFSSQQKEFLHEAIESSDRLVDLIDNMLDLSRLESDKMILDIQTQDICATAHNVYRELEPLAQKNALKIRIEAPETCLALFDIENIRRVLVNLVGNAIKFTPSGGRIRIAIEDKQKEVLVSVEDTGRGIPQNRIPELFKEFTQLGKEDSRRGTGLGLSICKKIIESHRGRIWAESILGQGSRFSFSLPKPS
jgi:PAS domain S-box-containing protein